MMTSSNNNSTNSITANATVSMQHQRQTQQQLQQQQRQQLMGLNICVMILCLMVVALTVSNVGVEHLTTRLIQEIHQQQRQPPSVDVNVIIETMLSLLLVVPISSSSV